MSTCTENNKFIINAFYRWEQKAHIFKIKAMICLLESRFLKNKLIPLHEVVEGGRRPLDGVNVSLHSVL